MKKQLVELVVKKRCGGPFSLPKQQQQQQQT